MVQPKDNIVINIGATTINLVFVEGGTFQMGGDRFDREKPIHEVKIASFYMSKFLVTQELYQEVLSVNPSKRVGISRPVERISWEDAKEFIKVLNERGKIKLTGVFRLPSEAEWEYAAKGGRYSQGYEYCGSDDLKQVGWYVKNSGLETKPVGLLIPNELGLYDMSGNVYEWCEDDWHSDYKSPEISVNGEAWINNRGIYRVVRGGFCYGDSVSCGPSRRDHYSPDYHDDDIGFRLVFWKNTYVNI